MSLSQRVLAASELPPPVQQQLSKLFNSKVYESALQKAFNALDKDRNGFLDEEEMFNCVTLVHDAVKDQLPVVNEITPQQITEFISTYDNNKNGVVEFSEFTELMKVVTIKTSFVQR